MKRPVALAVALAAVTVALPACGVSGLNFRVDDRVDIISPKDRSKVDLPVTVRWDVEDFTGTFGVFVDRAPQPANRSIEWLFRNDDTCRPADGCPDDEFLANRNIFRTKDTSFRIERLPDTERGDRREFHEVTIVLLDERGERVGESAFSVEFEVEREDES